MIPVTWSGARAACGSRAHSGMTSWARGGAGGGAGGESAGPAPPVVGAAREGQEHGGDVDARGELVAHAVGDRAEPPREVGDDQRNPDRLLVHPGALAAQPM